MSEWSQSKLYSVDMASVCIRFQIVKLSQMENFSVSFLLVAFLELSNYVLAIVRPLQGTNDITARILALLVPLEIEASCIVLFTNSTLDYTEE